MLVRNEDRRTKIWRRVMFFSSIVAVLLVAYILVKMFTIDPLSGNWVSEDGELKLQVQSADQAKAMLQNDEGQESVSLHYSLNRGEKKVTFKSAGQEPDNARLQGLTTMFYYSVDGRTMTLSNPEYGQEYIFEKN